MFSFSRLQKTLPLGILALGAALVSHGLLGFSDAQKVILRTGTGKILRTCPTGRYVWKASALTAILTLAAVYGYHYMNERYGTQIVSPEVPKDDNKNK